MTTSVMDRPASESRQTSARRQGLLRKPSDDPKRAIVEAGSAYDDLRVSVGDLLAVDFTVSSIAYDAAYIVSFGDDGLFLRIFQLMPEFDGERNNTHLFMKQCGAFEKVDPELRSRMKVHGEVMNVYRRD